MLSSIASNRLAQAAADGPADRFSEDEIAIIEKSRKEAAEGKGTPWRNVRDDV